MDGIHVETLIRGSLDELWDKTQRPELHRRWDLRFSDIQYLPRPDPSQPQRFLYVTRLGFGLTIRGEGETTGERLSGGTRTSALRFWSDDPKSLIRAGSGYWRYVPVSSSHPAESGVRFYTWYDYTTRFGLAGHLFDRLVFRPLIGWATAWSFDRLRLWIEQQRDPAGLLRLSVVHALARGALALAWLGLGVAVIFAPALPWLPLVRLSVGTASALLGLALLAAWRRRAPLLVSALLAETGLLADLVSSPAAALVSLFLLALALVSYFSGADLPTAARCRRRPFKEHPDDAATVDLRPSAGTRV